MEKTIKHTLYIGANNNTGLVEYSRITETINQYFDAFTIIDSVGYWKGSQENSIKVELLGVDEKQVFALTEKLKVVLNQEAIYLTKEVIEGVLI